MRGIPYDIAKMRIFSGFSAISERGAVTLHQEMSGITQKPAVRRGVKSPRYTGGSLS